MPAYTPLTSSPDAEEMLLLERIWEIFPEAMRTRDEFVGRMGMLYDSGRQRESWNDCDGVELGKRKIEELSDECSMGPGSLTGEGSFEKSVKIEAFADEDVAESHNNRISDDELVDVAESHNNRISDDELVDVAESHNNRRSDDELVDVDFPAASEDQIDSCSSLISEKDSILVTKSDITQDVMDCFYEHNSIDDRAISSPND